MDLSNFEQDYAKYGDRHPTNSKIYWNGFEWAEDDYKFWDFNLKRDWIILVVCGALVIGGGLIALQIAQFN